MTALKTKFLKYIDSVTNEEHLYEVIPPAPTETDRGGIIASPKTDLDTAEAKLGEDGKLYVNASVQIPSDWNQNDSTAQDYVKNKPFYISQEAETKTEIVDIVPENEFEFIEGEIFPYCEFEASQDFEIGQTYFVSLDGVVYELVCFEDGGDIAIGATWSDLESGNSDVPFQIYCYDGNKAEFCINEETVQNHTIRIYTSSTTVSPEEMYMNPKYVPHFQSNWYENDEEKLGYIQNKPFYISQEEETITEVTEIMPETTLEFEGEYYVEDGSIEFSLEIGQFYTVTWNGVTYENLECSELEGVPAIGTSDFSFTDYPFAIASGISVGYPMIVFMTIDPTTSHTISVSSITAKHIPEEMYMESKFVKHFQSNWDENDETKLSYIKNRPFYSNNSQILSDITLEFENNKQITDGSINFELEIGKTYTVIWNGVTYDNLICKEVDGLPAIGASDFDYSDCPIIIASGMFDGSYMAYFGTSDTSTTSHTISITDVTLKKIDDKFQHQADWNELDSSKASYILNKPFGDFQEKEHIEVLNEEFKYSEPYYFIEHEDFFEEEALYKVDINGNIYEGACYNDDGYLTISDTNSFYIFYDGAVIFNLNPMAYPIGTIINIVIQKVKVTEYVKKIDEKYLPENNVTKESIILKDVVNGYEYVVQMQNGQLVSFCRANSITISTMPNKTEYIEGEVFDPSGMIVMANVSDGSTKEITNYTYPDSRIKSNSTSIIITYIEGGIKLETEVPITVTSLEPMLIDFEYTKKTDGTYTLDEWKGTLNGEPSTEILIPNYSIINI